MIKDGRKQSEVKKQLSICNEQIRRWIQNEEKLIQIRERDKRTRLIGGGKKPLYPQIDQRLLQYYRYQTEVNNIHVTYNMLREFAISPSFGIVIPDDFKMSSKYLSGWSKRYGLSIRNRLTIKEKIVQRGLISIAVNDDDKMKRMYTTIASI
jgi:hypothetical protein